VNDLTKTNKAPAVRQNWKGALEQASPQFAASLPAHVSPDRFKRILSSAIGTNQDLLRAVSENPQSVWSSALAAAKDGLLPDGREAALVVFNTKIKCSDNITRSLATAQYMPMIGGILKMMRQSGEVASLSAQVVYDADDFDYELGDEERIMHRPSLAENRGKMIACYAILKTKDGGIYRELMGRDQVMAVKNISRAKNGPWDGPFESEMWKKTVLRRLAKRAPLSTDVLDLIQRDDGMYELPGSETSENTLPPAPPANSGNILDLSTGKTVAEPEAIEAEVVEEEPHSQEAEAEDVTDVLEGDDIPEEAKGTAPEPEPEEKDTPKPKAKTKTVAKPKEEPKEEPEEDMADAFPSKLAGKKAMRQADNIDDLDAIHTLCKSCSWYDGKGVPTTFNLLYEELAKDLKSEQE